MVSPRTRILLSAGLRMRHNLPMAARRILQLGDPLLREVSASVRRIYIEQSRRPLWGGRVHAGG
ncbi:MAG: hypothetical protein HY235_24355 [Acidobacteria bacterium]|nr:hypothetical protein [Acidobacteriota bacterium]